MIPLEIARVVAEGSLRAAFALGCVLALRRGLEGRASAGVRRALLLSAVLAVPLLPVAGAVLPGFAVSGPWPAGFAPLRAAAAAPGAAAPLHPGSGRILDAAALVWLAGACVLLVRLAAGAIAASRRVAAARPLTDPEWIADRDAVAARLGTSRTPEIRVAKGEVVPHAWGVARPVIVVPPSARAWPRSLRRAVLAHELAHHARREPLARVAAEAVRAVHWFDPLLRAAVVRLRRESELAADHAALAATGGAHDYAAHLLAVARLRLAAPDCRAVASFAAPGEFERRVEAILAAGARDARPRTAPAAARAAVGALALAAVAVTAVPRVEAGVAAIGRFAARYGIGTSLAGQILSAAEREGIEPGVAFGLIAEESAFDPDRTSPVGAVGLTQVLPSTAREVDPAITADELREVPVNLHVGFRYLRRQIDRERGDVAAGLVAYAIGPRRLETLRREGKPLPTGYPERILAHID